ncbi:MAG: hypothetical protein IOB84_02545 [Brevundimonas sp.]|nr:hypothetical protein [Brevundimonas sp.]
MLRDHLRQTEIRALGWTVVRFTNDTALGEPWRIDDAIRDRARVLGLLWSLCLTFPLPASGGRRGWAPAALTV